MIYAFVGIYIFGLIDGLLWYSAVDLYKDPEIHDPTGLMNMSVMHAALIGIALLIWYFLR